MCVSSHEHVTCMYIYTHVTIPKNGRWEKLSKSHSPCWTSARLTSPYKFVHATVLLLLRFGGFYQKQTKVQPATPWEMQAIVLAKGISRFETLQDSSFVPRLTQMWTDFNGSFKSCNKVQASSQTNSDHEKAWSKSLFSHMYSANSFFSTFYIVRMEYIRMLRTNLWARWLNQSYMHVAVISFNPSHAWPFQKLRVSCKKLWQSILYTFLF